MTITHSQIETTLKAVVDPVTNEDYVTSKAVRDIQIEQNDDVAVTIELGYPARSVLETTRQQIKQVLQTIPGIGAITVRIDCNIDAHGAQRNLKLLPGVKNIIAVASGKEGSANLQLQSILRWHSLLKALRLVCWMQIFTGHPSRKCWG